MPLKIEYNQKEMMEIGQFLSDSISQVAAYSKCEREQIIILMPPHYQPLMKRLVIEFAYKNMFPVPEGIVWMGCKIQFISPTNAAYVFVYNYVYYLNGYEDIVHFTKALP